MLRFDSNFEEFGILDPHALCNLESQQWTVEDYWEASASTNTVS